MKSIKMRRAGNGAQMRKREVHQGFGGGHLRERDHLEDSGLDGRTLLRTIFRKWNVWAWTGSMWLGIETGSGHL